MDRILGLFLVCSLLLSGCASYNTTSLPGDDTYAYSNRQTVKDITVAVEFFDVAQTKNIFQVDLFSKGYQPVYIVIDNRSSGDCVFNKKQINKNCYDASVIAEKCGFSIKGRAVRSVFTTLLFVPLAIPGIVDGTKATRANRRMKNDYAMKEIKNGRISPNGLLSGVVFVDKIANGEHFDIQLQDIKTNEIILFSFVR